MTCRTFVLTAALAAFTVPAAAQAPDGWTLERLLEQARTREPMLQAARLEMQAREADVRQAGLRANPKLTVEQRLQWGGMDKQTTAMAELPLELGRRGARTATARAELDVARASAADRLRLLEHEIHNAHHGYLAAARRVAILEQLVSEARRTLSLLEQRVAAGATPRLERDQAAVETRRVEVDLARATAEADAALIELQRVVGLAPSPSFRVVETLESMVEWPHLDVAVAGDPGGASPGRADLVAAEAQVGVETARAAQARAEGRVDLSVFGGVMRMTSGFPQKGFDDAGMLMPIEGRFTNLAAGVMVDIPLFNRNQGAVAAAEIRANASRRDLDARRLGAAAEVAAAHARLRSAVAAARLFTQQLRDLARQNVDVVREAYALGRSTLLDVITEQNRYLDVEMAYTEALMDVLDAHAAWQAATGRQQ